MFARIPSFIQQGKTVFTGVCYDLHTCKKSVKPVVEKPSPALKCGCKMQTGNSTCKTKMWTVKCETSWNTQTQQMR